MWRASFREESSVTGSSRVGVGGGASGQCMERGGEEVLADHTFILCLGVRRVSGWEAGRQECKSSVAFDWACIDTGMNIRLNKSYNGHFLELIVWRN